MSDDPTRQTHDSRSFEERVFARFDTLDARMDRIDARMDRFESRQSSLEGKVDALDGRLTALEEKVDSRLRETRPIWEAVQARLDGIEKEVKEANRGIMLLHQDNLRIRVNQEELRERVEKLESQQAG